jgi:aminopeptidase B
VLDAHHLAIHSITSSTTSSSPLPFTLTPFTAFGSALRIPLPSPPPPKGSSLTLTLHFSSGTGPSTCWLSPAQTAGKVHPFLFTQGQAALNRSFFPCQDSPSVRSTYEAVAISPAPLSVVMAALAVGPHEGADIAADADEVRALAPPGSAGAAPSLRLSASASASASASSSPPSSALRVFRFRMPYRIPIYLAALAAGDVACADLSPRSRVWAERVLVDKAAWEFGHGGLMEKYIVAGEALFGPYPWERYDMMLMPPSFPYGGMEDVTCSFLTPALLAGDQSLTDVVAHELSHSYSGNLVTNASWSDFFLNEGFTMYAQRAITSMVTGEAVTSVETATGRALLAACMRDLGEASPLARLRVPVASGVDPDDTYCETAYEKGYAFVCYLEAACGSPEAFRGWFRAYMKDFAFQSVSAEQMLCHYLNHFPALRGRFPAHDLQAAAAELAAGAEGYWASPRPYPVTDEDFAATSRTLPAAALAACREGKDADGLAYVNGFEFARWLHEPGWPPYYPALDAARSLTAPAEEAAGKWVAAALAASSSIREPPAGAEASVWRSWHTYQKLHFLDTLQSRVEAGFDLVPSDRAASRASARAFDACFYLLMGIESAYGLGETAEGRAPNAEVRLRWSILVASAQYLPGFPAVLAFAQWTGKQKYTLPVYRALLTAPPLPSTGTSPAKDLALDVFCAHRDALHVTVRAKAQALLEGAGMRV